MSTLKNWLSDLDFGEAGEQRFCARHRGWQRAETKNVKFDLAMAEVTAEIKTERYAVSKIEGATPTQNLCVEFQNTRQNKPSGLFASELEATYWVHQFECGAEYVFRTSSLRNHVESNKESYQVVSKPNSRSYLVPISEVEHLVLCPIVLNGQSYFVSKAFAAELVQHILQDSQ